MSLCLSHSLEHPCAGSLVLCNVLSNLGGWGYGGKSCLVQFEGMGGAVGILVLSNLEDGGAVESLVQFRGILVSNLWDSCLVQFGWWGLGGGARVLSCPIWGRGGGGRNLVPPNFVHGITNHIVALSVCTTMKNDKK